ncbi:allophanate hydrolase [Tsukamurella soli]|uniref:Allophanate hydrolase n=1 Tax=Tsukamurella soli TaxID=644556 RepID=A0ABP8JDB9_9ACTN
MDPILKAPAAGFGEALAAGFGEALAAGFHERLAAVARPEIFVSTRPQTDIDADLAAAQGPLAGLTLAVKDNVDAAGLPTTAGCPSYSYRPRDDAAAVAALRAAGAVVVGKTNLDQFATGLVGTRSPYGPVRDARRPDRISGGSSSGSAVAVALGLADLAVGTDTAGSGRVPAGLQGIVGIKPTRGVVPTDGVVPACASYDCVTILARDLDTAGRAMTEMARGGRAWPADVRFGAPPRARVAYPDRLLACDDEVAAAFAAVIASGTEHVHPSGTERVFAFGEVDFVPIDMTDFLAAAKLLYEGALVAERYDAVGAFVEQGSVDLDPTVAAIVRSAGRFGAVDLLRDRAEVERLRTAAMARLDGCDALVVPTAPTHPTLAEVEADPVGVNSRMGTYTNFCNLFDMCAASAPVGIDAGGAQFGITVLARAFDDAVAADIAGRLTHQAVSPWVPAAHVDLAVFGAHLPGQPLAHQLTDRGAAWLGDVRTARSYRLMALDTQPPKPGLVRVGPGGASIRGGLWRLSPAALGAFLAELPRPMLLGRVELDDGREVVGFGCEAEAADRGVDITARGGWL